MVWYQDSEAQGESEKQPRMSTRPDDKGTGKRRTAEPVSMIIDGLVRENVGGRTREFKTARFISVTPLYLLSNGRKVGWQPGKKVFEDSFS